MHLYDRLDPERGRDHAPQLRAIRRPHPPVRADEAQDSANLELTQPGLDEAHVDVTAADHRRVQAPVGRQRLARHVVIPDVGRVADHDVGPPVLRGHQQVVADAYPALGQFPGLSRAGTAQQQFSLRQLDGPRRRISVELTGADRPQRVSEHPPACSHRREQPTDHRHQEGALARRRLHRVQCREILLGPVPGKIQDQVHHPRLGIDNTPRLLRSRKPRRPFQEPRTGDPLNRRDRLDTQIEMGLGSGHASPHPSPGITLERTTAEAATIGISTDR